MPASGKQEFYGSFPAANSESRRSLQCPQRPLLMVKADSQRGGEGQSEPKAEGTKMRRISGCPHDSWLGLIWHLPLPR